ncbi:MAG: hypothetical protein E7354_03635 [Clostridiales bacterium]|nr:hypothetical protein [Clostridiales bacterium]
MAKKKSKNTGLILSVVVLVLGVAAFCMSFLTGVKYISALTKETAFEFTGFQTMFGYTETTGSIIEVSSKFLGFSILATLAFVLPLVGAVLTFVKNKIARLVGAVLMLAGAVMLFLLPSFVVLATVDGNLTAAAAMVKACETSTLGIGAILGGVFAGLGGLVAGFSALKK